MLIINQVKAVLVVVSQDKSFQKDFKVNRTSNKYQDRKMCELECCERFESVSSIDTIHVHYKVNFPETDAPLINNFCKNTSIYEYN